MSNVEKEVSLEMALLKSPTVALSPSDITDCPAGPLMRKRIHSDRLDQADTGDCTSRD